MTEITDEMVDRAENAFVRDFIEPGKRFSTMHVRGLLEAALNPKPEPEIEVTEGMLEAGRCAAIVPGMGFSHARMASIYRAMESTRLKEAAYAAKDARQGECASGSSWSHSRGGRVHQHRRKTDPA